MAAEMMTEAPPLSPDALVRELQHIHRKHTVRNTVLLARMSPFLEAIEVPGEQGRTTFRVAQARCELELRAVLAEDPTAEPTVVLIDWDPGRLPADLMGRVTGRAVQTIARARRLRLAFSNAQVSDELLLLQNRPLVEAIVNDPTFRRASPPGGLVTLDAAWRAWLVSRRIFGQETETEATLVARFAREPLPTGLGGFFRQHDKLLDALYAWIESALGHVARQALRLWLSGEGRTAAALAFVLDATRGSVGAGDFVDGILTMKLAEVSPSLGDRARSDPRMLARWADLAGLLAAQFEVDPAHLLRIVDAADKFLPAHPAVTEVLSRSDYMRTALDARKRSLADALTRAADDPSDEASRAVLTALDAVGRHKLRDVDPGQRELFERARMAARLVGWLAVRARDIPYSASVNEVVMFSECAEDYLRQGAFADFARRVARGGTAEPLGVAIQRVVERADAQRDRDDERFSRALVTWNELGRPADRVLPIESVLDRFAARFLQGDATRRVLVILLDGMAWANTVELLESLEEAHYAPLRWPVPGIEQTGVPPVIAALPTITDVSRAALFAGELLRPKEGLDSSRDPLRFETHKSLRALGEKPRLLLKAQLQTASGDCSAEALELVSSSTRVVGVVINAIDDQLKAGRQTRVAFSLETIKPLRDLLDRATMAHRAVLLVSDHGHVSGARVTASLRRTTEDAGGARWRSHRADMAVSEGEVHLGGTHVWRPAGVERLALVARETASYGMGTAAGEHGGATLAEVVAPAILVGAESLAERAMNANDRGRVDADLEVRPLTRPPWWSLRALPPPTLSAPTPMVTATQHRPKSPTTSAQIPLAGLGLTTDSSTPKQAPAATRSEPSQWKRFFDQSKALKGSGRQMEDRFVAVVDALAASNGALSEDRLAQALGILPSRIGGLIASVQEILNGDETQVLQHRTGERMVFLNLDELREIFG